jgi:hypothetical protein
MRRPRLVGVLWRWHRRLGVLAAVFALVLAGTGIALNHVSELGLDRRFVDWPWLSRAYGDTSADLPAFQLGAHWLSRAADGRIYLDTREVAPCSGKLVGALESGGLLYAACADELLVITGEGELVESLNHSTGLSTPLTAIGLAGSQLLLQAAGTWWLADLDRVDFSASAPGGAVISQLAPGRLPDAVRQGIPAPDAWLSWERLLLDLHSGRLFGRLGVLWVDLVGVLLASLAMSGIAMWWLHRRRRHRPRG